VQQVVVGVQGQVIDIPPPEIWLVSNRFPDRVPKVKLDSVPLEQYRTLHWLQDGRLLVIVHNYELEKDVTSAEFLRPETGQFLPVDESQIDDFSRLYFWLISENMESETRNFTKEQFDFQLSLGPEHFIGSTVYPSSRDYTVEAFRQDTSSLCKSLTLFSRPLEQAFFPVSIYYATVVESSLLILNEHNQTVTHVQTVAPGCDEMDITQRVVQVSLVKPYQHEILFQTDDLGAVSPRLSVAFAGDATHMVWTSHSAVLGRSSLLLTDLATGETEELLAVTFDAAQTTSTITALAWTQ
jgi:hypothetical protein